MIIYAGWQLAYDLYLLPDGRLDTFLSLSGVRLASHLLTLMGISTEVDGRIIACVGSRAVEINNGCNGLQLFGMFSGFIISYPGKWRDRIILLLLGSFSLYTVNVIRIAFFALINSLWPEYWDLAHNTSSYIFFYPVVLTFWYICTKITQEDSLLVHIQK